MPSILQQQLQQVSTTWGAPTGKRQRGKPSLIYTAQEAADVDLQSLYELAQEGEQMYCEHPTVVATATPSLCAWRSHGVKHVWQELSQTSG